MTREDIIRMAQEAGLPACHTTHPKALGRFAALVAAAEREACAKVCEEQRSIEWVKASMPALIKYEPENLMANKCAAAIRARGQ